MYWTKPSAVRWMVDIIFRPESKGASPTRGVSASMAGLLRPILVAQFTRAHSVGSPTALPVSSGLASEHRDMARAVSASSPQWSTTVILFWVRVPVLSEQMTWAQPRVSTAVSLRMTALRLDMLVTPMDSTMVTTVARPSGMAATARLTATMKVLTMVSMSNRPARSRLKAKMNTQMPSTRTLRIRLSWPSFRCRGVSPSSAWARASAILPISVVMPVSHTTARPRP